MKKIVTFNLKNSCNVADKIKPFTNKKYKFVLEINLLLKENHADFFNLQMVLSKKFPQIYPIELKLNKRLVNTANFYIY